MPEREKIEMGVEHIETFEKLRQRLMNERAFWQERHTSYLATKAMLAQLEELRLNAQLITLAKQHLEKVHESPTEKQPQIAPPQACDATRPTAPTKVGASGASSIYSALKSTACPGVGSQRGGRHCYAGRCKSPVTAPGTSLACVASIANSVSASWRIGHGSQVPIRRGHETMLLRHYLNALESKHISVQGDAHSPTLRELGQSHHAYLDSMVITHHVNGRLHKAQVRTADWGVYLFTIRY